MSALVTEARRRFHAGLLEGGVLSVDAGGIPSNADKGNRASIAYAAHIAQQLAVETIQERRAGQSLGGDFEKATAAFLNETFPAFTTLRPGRWTISKLGGNRRGSRIAQLEPYTHLAELDRVVTANPDLAAVLGNAYAITPDVIVTRQPESGVFINSSDLLVDAESARRSSIRLVDQPHDILHAVISCKWTLRSDRAQNARSEALNLIRNRKGRTPHIVVVTGEPTPSRLSSLALGTGDIDCVYHFALPELISAVESDGHSEPTDLLHMMVEGRRLKDIADLPLDLTV